MPTDDRARLNRYLALVTIAGCLAMVYTTAIGSPMATEFFHGLGATEMDFGLLAGVPMILLFMQFLGAYLSNRVPRRKPWFMTLAIAGRLLYLPLAFLPLFFPESVAAALVPVLIGLTAVSNALGNFTVPIWFSWMSDIIPRRVLNRYWGVRMGWMTFVWTLSFLAIAGFGYLTAAVAVRLTFPILVSFGVVAGVVDILLFLWIREPANAPIRTRRLLDELLEPVRHRDYRTMMLFACAFSASTMFAASFMQLYVLKVLEVEAWKATLIWCTSGLGNAVVARSWGRIADRYGHRPVLVICTLFKPVVAVVFVLVTPATAFLVLTVTFFFDSMCNAGNAIAQTGYMLKMTPRQNRSTFIASFTALTGFCGGVAAIASGALLRHLEGVTFAPFDHPWNNYQIVFAVSVVLRTACIPLAAAVREPRSASPVVVMSYIGGLWPMRMLLFPVGLVRWVWPDEDDGAAPSAGRAPPAAAADTPRPAQNDQPD